MLLIGCHLSMASGYKKMVEDAQLIHANTLQFFSRNPRGGTQKKIDPTDVQQANDLLTANKFGKLVIHAPYVVNPCSAEESTRLYAARTIAEDLTLLENFPHNYYTFHPGSHVGQGVDEGINFIANALNQAIQPELTTTVLLETMAGKGSEIGRCFEELKAIRDRVELNEKIGICLDTCHIFSAGYDIVNHLDDVLAEFDRIIGLDQLKAIHLNDSMMPFSEHKDRHAKIGEGLIGIEAIANVINHPFLHDLPFILETPHDDLNGYAEEIQLLRSLVQE